MQQVTDAQRFILQLLQRDQWNKREFRCLLTFELDTLSKIDQDHYYDLYHHYILADQIALREKCFPIRVPGGTVGAVRVDDNNVITKIHVDTDYVIRTYPENVNDLLKKYVGWTLEKK